MPQVLVFAAIGAVALAGYKLFKSEAARVARTLDEMRPKEAVKPIDHGTLVRGADGVYRPAGSDRG